MNGTVGSILLAAFLCACGPQRIPPSEMTDDQLVMAYPTVLTLPSELLGDFAMQQEVTITHPEGEHTFTAVLQKQGDTLTMLALGPHGGRAFLLTQRSDGAVEFERYIDIEFPFPPRYILHDVHRTWFARTPSEGDERDGERIVDTFVNERLTQRTFERVDGRPEGIFVVNYEGGLEAGAPLTARPPDEVTISNAWFGYTSRIRTIQWQALPANAPE